MTFLIALIFLASLLKISLLIIGLAVVAWLVYEIIIAPLIEDYEDERDL